MTSDHRQNHQDHFRAPLRRRQKDLVVRVPQGATAEVQRPLHVHPQDNEVQVVRGHYKDQQIGKVVQVYRKNMSFTSSGTA